MVKARKTLTKSKLRANLTTRSLNNSALFQAIFQEGVAMYEHNGCGALHTDLYQLSMAYAYWKNGRADAHAVFDLFFRKNPFGGEFTVFAGLSEVVAYAARFQFLANDIAHVRKLFPHAEEEFFTWLAQVGTKSIKIYAPKEGSLMFPRVPLARVERPLAIAQMLETPFLNFTNFPSLISTNAAHFRLAAGNKLQLMEFGLRRAQGPDGGLSASRYAYLGGFDATSNVQAGESFGIPSRGTMAHAFILSFTGIKDLRSPTIRDANGQEQNLLEM